MPLLIPRHALHTLCPDDTHVCAMRTVLMAHTGYQEVSPHVAALRFFPFAPWRLNHPVSGCLRLATQPFAPGTRGGPLVAG